MEPSTTRTTAGAVAACLSLAFVLASAASTLAQERVTVLRPEWLIAVRRVATPSWPWNVEA